MKKNILLLGMVVLLAIAGTSLSSCGKDDDDDDDDVTGGITPLEKAALEKLSASWTQTAITQNGAAPEIAITTSPVLSMEADLVDGKANTYSVSSAHYVLPAPTNPAWSFVTGSNFTLVQLDGFQVGVESVSATELKLKRVVDTELAAGRTATVGDWIMTFSKN